MDNCLTTAYTGENLKEQIKKQPDVTLSVSPFPYTEVYDVVQRVSRMN